MYKFFNRLIFKFLNTQRLFFRFFFGYMEPLDPIGFSIWSRIKGRLGIRNHVDVFVEVYGVKRLKKKIFYESNSELKQRTLKSVRSLSNREGL